MEATSVNQRWDFELMEPRGLWLIGVPWATRWGLTC